MPLYRILGRLPKTLAYRDGTCVVFECVEDESRIAYPWVFRARKLQPGGASCIITHGVSRHRLDYALRVDGFSCEAGTPEKRIMDSLVAAQHAQEFRRR